MNTDYLIVKSEYPITGSSPDGLNKLHINGYQITYGDDVLISQFESGFCLYISQDLRLGFLEAEDLLNVINEFYQQGKFSYRKLKHSYTFVFINNETGETNCFTDLFKNINVYYYLSNDHIAITNKLKNIARIQELNLTINNTAIYDYLNFSYIPSPLTIYNEVSKLEPSSRLLIDSKGVCTTSKYWVLEYNEREQVTEAEEVEAIRDQIRSSVSRNIPAIKTSSFLSGGTDSSAITSILSDGVDYTIDSYSIGFNEEVFSELEYVDIVQKSLGHHSNTHRLSASESFDLIETLNQSFDEPYGNSSVLATYSCAKLAAMDGYKVMLAGDGGDEIFGGNERYGKDYYFTKYESMPFLLKQCIELPLPLFSKIDTRFVNRARNFVKRANKKNPERFYMDDSFASDHFEDLLTDKFRESVDARHSLDHMSEIYHQASADAEVNKLMYLDLMMAISENDITKVNASTALNNIDVIYPYLDIDLVEYMAKLPSNLKVNKTKKRYAYKKAISTFVPDEIINKKKQGFGMPLSLWFKEDKQFNKMVTDTFSSSEFKDRGIFNPEFCKKLLDRHVKGVWNYSHELWIILNLELWFKNNI